MIAGREEAESDQEVRVRDKWKETPNAFVMRLAFACVFSDALTDGGFARIWRISYTRVISHSWNGEKSQWGRKFSPACQVQAVYAVCCCLHVDIRLRTCAARRNDQYADRVCGRWLLFHIPLDWHRFCSSERFRWNRLPFPWHASNGLRALLGPHFCRCQITAWIPSVYCLAGSILSILSVIIVRNAGTGSKSQE